MLFRSNVRSLLKTTVHRRKFLANREQQRQQTARVPDIVVDPAPRLSVGGLRIDLSNASTPPGSPQGSPTNPRFALTPGSQGSDDEDSYFDRSAGSSFGSPGSASRSQRHSIAPEDGEEFVNQVSSSCSSAAVRVLAEAFDSCRPSQSGRVPSSTGTMTRSSEYSSRRM